MRVEFISPALHDLEDLRIYLSARSTAGYAHSLGDIETTVLDIGKGVSCGCKALQDDVWERASNRY